MRWSRLARVAAVTMLATASQCIPPAQAVSPPPIDNTLLPAAAPPAPQRPTVQREVCTVPGFDPRHTDAHPQLDSLDLPAVWALTRGAGQRIAVIDTGVSTHRRLPRLHGGGDYAFTGDGTQDCDGHGTSVAGIIAATPDSDGFSGVAPEAALIGIRQSSGKFGAADDPAQVGVGDVETLAQSVRTAADLGASVISVSPVACVPVGSGLDDRALGAALAYAVDVKNAVVVAAAGNTGECLPHNRETGEETVTVTVSPAWYDEYVLAVGSVDASGAPSDFTLGGPWVDVAAPGEAVLSLSPVGDAMANGLAGTSYAAAAVAGVAALVRARFPAWTPHQVMQRITATAHHPPGGRNGLIGHGVVDPLAAVSSAKPDTAAAPVNTPPSPEATGRRTALTGAAVLFTVLLAALAVAGCLRRRQTNSSAPITSSASRHPLASQSRA